MRVLVLTTTLREPDNHLLWEGLKRFVTLELVYISKDEQRQLGRLLRRIDFSRYDRVVLDLLFRHVSRQALILSRVPGLVIYEEDACQEFIPASKWFGKFSSFYRKVPHARVVFTGFRVSDRFKALGVDACFLPKGYDSTKLYDLRRSRDIQLGFIGRLGSDAYRERREFLERVAAEHGLQILRTEPGDAYRETLNRIAIFISADIGLGEYMAKNFEAMACGCTLMAYRQGAGEEEALGLIDGRNVVLYDSYEHFVSKLSELLARPENQESIADCGVTMVRERFDYRAQAERFYVLMQDASRLPGPRKYMTRLADFFGFT